MDYNFSTLNTRDFEHMVQALSQKLLGKTSIVFGDGPDGARELTYKGLANFPNEKEIWDGYWIIQAKYKTRAFDTTSDGFTWIKQEFEKEMQKFDDPDRKLEIPNNYIFFTNAVLTAVHGVGGRDKIEAIKQKYTKLIPNIHIVSYDDLCRLLDNNRDVATTFSSFILSGDILSKLYDLLEYKQLRKTNTQRLFLNYLEKTFLSEMYSKLIQAGDLTNQINIEKVFIDIDVTNNSNPNTRVKFLEKLIKLGNSKWDSEKSCKLVLVGGAGSGKSTLSQFASQIYTAFFISDNKKEESNEKVKEFIHDYSLSNKPECLRFPFKIVLKDYATWVKEQQENRDSKSVLNYIKHRVEIIGDGLIDIETVREFLSKVSTLIVFDGLDEVPITSNRNDVLKEINDFIDIELRNLKSDSIILCTTRQQGYTREFDENTFNHFYVSELSDDDCIIYLKKLLDNIENSYDDRLNYLKTLKTAILDEVAGRLMRTPLQATIMTILVKSGGKPSRNKYNLFKEYYETIYKRELQKEFLPILKDYKRNIDDIHALLGFELQAKSEGKENPSALFERKEFEELIRLYLKQKEEWEDKDIDDFIIILTKAVTERLVFICEIQDEKIGFIIRSLQEYFAANYIINYSDDIVSKSIVEIANSSYWRNTFLFVVSGLHNTKNHLIDQVYLNCERLNGTEDDPNIPIIQNTLFCGSWISLDILTEGIFSDSPKNRNRFIILLEKIFTFPNTGELKKFEYFSNDILLNLIANKYIKDNLFSEKSFLEKFTSFKLSMHLLKNAQLYDELKIILNQTWRQEYEFQLINIMFEMKNFEIDFFFEKLHDALIKKDFLKYKRIFEFDHTNEYRITKKIVQLYKYDDLFISHLVEIIFLSTFGKLMENGDKEIFTVYNDIMDSNEFVSSNSLEWSFLDKNYNLNRTDIVDGYSIEIAKINSNNFNLDAFYNLLNKYSIRYLCSYIDFLRSPDLNSLSIFLSDLENNNDDETLNILIDSSRVWLIKELSFIKCIYDIKRVNEFLQKSKIGINITAWLNYEDKVINNLEYNNIFKYASLYSCSESSFDLTNSFYVKFKDEILRNDHYIILEFIRLFSWSPRDKKDDNLTFKVEILNAVLNCLNTIDIQKLNKWNIYTLKSGVLNYIHNTDITNIDRLKTELFELFNFGSISIEIREVKNLEIDILDKLITHFNYNQNSKTEKRIELLITYLIYISGDITIDLIKRIQFKTNQFDSDDNLHILLIRLMTTQFNFEDINLILQRIIEDNYMEKFAEITSYLFFKLNINESWCSVFFVKLYSILKNKDIDVETILKIEQYLKLINESTQTNMSQLQLS